MEWLWLEIEFIILKLRKSNILHDEREEQEYSTQQGSHSDSM